MTNLKLLIDELRKLPTETSWVEFKHNNFKPDMIGEDVSALANAATLIERECAYMIWGVENDGHHVVGTSESLQSIKVGHEELENWLRHNLSDNADFEFDAEDYDGLRVAVLKVGAAVLKPVSFKREPYVRIGSITKKLRTYPEVESKLWDRLKSVHYELMPAMVDVELQQVEALLDMGVYFEETHVPIPMTLDALGKKLCSEDIISRQDNGLYAITNMGALLFARHLSDFPRINRKDIRILQYKGTNKAEQSRDKSLEKGYAVGFKELISLVMAMTPCEEPIINGVRETKTMYPEISVRELVANALIHQNLSVTGAGPMIEIFSNRIEITNPGRCLVDIERIIDCPPKSRNEKLAAIMRRMHMCEEAGGGWDKAVLHCEIKNLPAPSIKLYEDSVKVCICAKVPFASMSQDDKVWASYLHACLQYVQGDYLTNASLRKRFGLGESAAGSISRVIKEAVTRGCIRAFDPNTAPRYMKYIPHWG